MIPTHNEWKTFRDKHADGPGKGAVKAVSMGKVCDTAAKVHAKGDLATVAKIYPALVKDMTKYRDSVKKKHPKFAADLDKKFIKPAQDFGFSAVEIHKPAKAMDAALQALAKFAARPEFSTDKEAWVKLYKAEAFRNIEKYLLLIVDKGKAKQKHTVPILNNWKRVVTEVDPAKSDDQSLGSNAYRLQDMIKRTYDASKKAGLF